MSESKNDTIKRLVRENHKLEYELAKLKRVREPIAPVVVERDKIVYVNQTQTPAFLRVSSDLYKAKKLLDWHKRTESLLKKSNLELKKDLNTRIDPKYLIAVCTALTGERDE